MFLASVAHLLPSDIRISNRRQQELALNFSAAHYSALSGKCWPERATSWSSYSFRQAHVVNKSHKFDPCSTGVSFLLTKMSTWSRVCWRPWIPKTEPNYFLIKCYLILCSRYLIIYKTVFFCQCVHKKVLKMHTQLKNARAASVYRWSFNWIIKIIIWY